MTELVLHARLDLSAAGTLHAALLARSGAPLRIDAGAVTHLGALCLQILLAAARDWRRRGVVLMVDPVSPQFDRLLSAYGLGPADLQSTAAQEAAWA